MADDQVSIQEIEQCFNHCPEVVFVKAAGDGYHYSLTVVSDRFIGASSLLRQQWVYAQLGDYMTSGRVHALSMKTWTVSEWEKQHG